MLALARTKGGGAMRTCGNNEFIMQIRQEQGAFVYCVRSIGEALGMTHREPGPPSTGRPLR